MTHRESSDVVVIGNGMVGHRFVEAIVAGRSAGRVVVIGEESRKAYDRVHLSSLFDGVTESDLTLTSDEIDASDSVEYVLGDPVVELDTDERLVTTASGRAFRYGSCVLATGSSPFVPPIPGTDVAGSFVYRTIDDIEAMREWSTRCTRGGVVVGGGLLGLEAANALRLLGLEVTVVEYAPRLMAVQLDEGGGRALRRRIEELGLIVRTGAGVTAVETTSDGVVRAVSFGENDSIDTDPATGTWQRVILGEQHEVLGAVLVGDVAPFNALVQRLRSGKPSLDVLDVLRPTAGARSDPLADDAGVCSCHNVTCGWVRAAVSEGFEDVAGVKKCTKAGTGCGSCVPTLQLLIDEHLAASGREVVKRLCRHFAMTRPELYEVVKLTGIRTFAELIGRHGSGHGCEICKPVAASIFASLGSGYILDGEQASLQDSNDHFLANLQRDGTYSVVLRVPGGEITPEQLIAIGEVARQFDLYTKITGGQRIDLFGARVEQLPLIWARLVAAGMESGHAYGKALRTVKSCVGTAWCRYGVQDSTAMAIELENRYRGLRAPHKIKLAVSGCARECAEAQSKDVGVIATERGWNLYVGGNGGMRPAHAVLLAEDLDDAALIQAIDRYLMWYVRTADRLERAATWQRKLPGGIDFVRRVVIDDLLAIGAELDARPSCVRSLGGDAGANHIENLSGDSDGLQTVGVRRFVQVGRIPAFDRPASQLGKLDRYEGTALVVG